MQSDDKRKALYEGLKETYDLGATYEDFSKKLDDPAKAKAFYDAVGKDYDLGDTFDAFQAKIAHDPAPQQPAAPANAQPAAPEQPVQVPDLSQAAPAESTTTQKPQVTDPVRTSYNPVSGENEVSSPFQQMVEDLGRVNAINAELEGAKSRKNISGGAYVIEEEASGPVLPRNNSISKDAKNTIGRLEAEKKQLMSRLDMNPEYRKHISDEADAVADMKSEVEQRIAERGSNAGQFVPYSGDFGPGAASPSVDIEDTKDRAALRLYDDAEKMLRSPFKYDDSSGWSNHFKGVEDKISDPDFWTMGLSEILDLSILRNVLQKVENEADRLGEKGIEAMTEDDADLSFLTPGEQALFDAYFTNLNARRMRADDMSSGYKSGQTAADSIKFMVEMGYSGAAGKAASKGMKKYLTKKLASRLSGMNSKSLGYKMAKNLGGFGIKKAGHIVSTAAGIPLTPEMPLGTLRRATELDEQGRLPEIDLKLVADGTLDAALEYFTEQGSVVADGLKVLGKVAPVNNIVKGILGDNAADFIKSMSKSAVATLMKQGAWNGFIDEGLEELDNAFYDYIRGNEDALTDFFKTDNLLELSASFAGMSVFGSVGSAAQVAKVNYDYSAAERDLREMMADNGYSEEQIQHVIDVANNSSLSDLSAALSNVIVDSYSQQAARGTLSAVRGGTSRADFQVVRDFVDATARRTAMNGIHQGRQDERIEEERDRLVGELGHRFWQHTNVQSGNFDGFVDEKVVMAQVKPDAGRGFQEGQYVFLTSTPDPNTGEMGYVTEDGRSGFLTSDDIVPIQYNGAQSMAIERPLREYLSYRVMQRDAESEQQRIAEQVQPQVDQIQQQFEVEDEITVGNRSGVVVGKSDDGLQVEFPAEGNKGPSVELISWEQVAQQTGQPLQAQTEEEEIAVDLGEQQAQEDREKQAEQVVLANTDRLAFEEDGVTYTPRDWNPVRNISEDGEVTIAFKGSDGSTRYMKVRLQDIVGEQQAATEETAGAAQPETETPAPAPSGYEIPRTEDGEIDYDRLMDENPEEFARINDEEAQDGGESTKTLFKNRIAELNKELKENQEKLAKQSKPSEMKKYQRKVADIQDKIAKLQSVLDSYNAVEEVPAAPVAEAPAAPAPAETPAPTGGMRHEKKRKAKRYSKILSQYGDYLDFEDFVMQMVAGDNIRFKWSADGNLRGIGDLFGYSAAEQRKRINILDGNNGVLLEAAIEQLLNAYAEERGVDVDQLEVDAIDAVGIVEGVLRGYSVKEMIDEVQRRHSEAEYDPMQDEDYVQEMREYEARKYGLTVEEYDELVDEAASLGVGTDELWDRWEQEGQAYMELTDDLPETDEEWEEINNQFADENYARELLAGEAEADQRDSEQEPEIPVDTGEDEGQEVDQSSEAGPAVLPGEQPADGGVRPGDEVGGRQTEEGGRNSGGNEIPGGSVRGGADEAERAEVGEVAPVSDEAIEDVAAEAESVENIPEMPEELQEEASEAEETAQTTEESAEEEQPAAEEEAPQQEEFVPTEEQIRNSNIPEELKTMAIAYLNGDRSFANQIAYQNAIIEIQNNVGDSTQTGAADSSDAGSAQMDSGTDETPAAGSGQRGEPAGDVAGEGGTEDVSGNDGRRPVRGRKNRPSHGVPASGERSDNGVAGGEPGLFDEPADGGRSDVGGTSGGSGRDVRGAEPGQDGGTSAGETAERGTDTGSEDVDSAIESLKGELSDLWKDFTKAGQSSLSLSLVGMNGQQIQILGKILATAARLGYQFLKKGFRSLQNFREKIREVIGDPLKQVVGYSDAEIDEFINEIWDAPYTMNGETHKISEWASIIGQEELRKEMARSLDEKREMQKEAEKVKVKVADEDNIRETLPFLLPAQREDVRRAEVQFFDESHNDRDHAFGKGYMFTNGTGTGKTYTGLGIAKRFIKQGKGRILILTPSQEKVSDWVKDAGNLQIKLQRLDNTQDKGNGAVVTTYANFRQNRALMEDAFDLVIYDESHRIMENKEGEESIGTKTHYMLTNRDEDAALDRLKATHPLWIKEEELQETIKSITDKLSQSQDYNEATELEAALTRKQAELDTIRSKQEAELPDMKVKASESVPKTKVVFLSATPFNTVQNLEYAERYIFTYPEEDESTKGSSRHKSPKEEFMERWFGSMISYKGGKQVSSIENEDAVTKQEVAFSDYLQNVLQTMNGRIIDSEYDYSRDFPIVEVALANQFNSAMEDIRRHPLMGIFSANDVNAFGHLFDYNWSSFLFEAMKVSGLLPRIREHLSMGRKIVIFHRRINAPGARPESEKELNRRKKAYPPVQPPFALGLQQAMDAAAGTRDAAKAAQIMAAVKMFREKYADLLQWEQTLDYRSAREQLIDAFASAEDRKKFDEEHEKWVKKAEEAKKNGKKIPAEPTLKAGNIGLFSGQESKGAKHNDVEAFNSDEGKDIIIVQESSGKEGISLHDQTGAGHQRVMISMALPQSPITFIQQEGRIYRIGNKSNAIFEYPLLGLNLELSLFSKQFNSRAGTTENLALGSLGRGLKRAIAQGVLERQGVIPLEGQGIGGKEWDARQSTDGGASGYDGAIADYYTNVKKKSGRENREGVDYYPTPEPIGFKMVEWGKIVDGESVLEPSAGHGAIARYVPTANELTAIEPSQDLNARLSILIGGGNRKIKDSEFEEYNVVNKHDVILMNPPYGTGGKTAAAHLAKAFDHLEEGGRLIAILPDGPAMEKRFDSWLLDTPAAVVTGEVKLPPVAFDRAGTSVRTRIVVIDKVSRAEARKTVPAKQEYDFSDIEKIDDLFEKMRNVNMPERTIDQIAIKMRAAKRILPEFKKIEDVVSKKSEFNAVTEDALKIDVPKARFDKMYIPMGGYYRWGEDGKKHAVLQISFSETEPLSRETAMKYKRVMELNDLDDNLFSYRATNRAYRLDEKDIDSLRQFYKIYMKAIRDLSGLTEAQILRVADGLSIDINPAEIEGDLTLDDLREKFDVANGENEERKELFDKVFAVAKKLGLSVNVYSNSGNDVANFNLADNSLNINRAKWNRIENEVRAQTILHEMIHSVTSYALFLYEIMENNSYVSAEQERMIDEVMNTAMVDACNDLKSVYRLITSGQESRHFAGEYGLTDVHEMVAELSNPQFRAKLKARNLWKRIVNGIKRLLGFAAEDAEQTTAEKEILTALDTLLDNFDPEKYEKARAAVTRGHYNITKSLELPDISPEMQRQADIAYANGILTGSIGIAPNGNASNLTNDQWALVRTRNFKWWFGDWDKYGRIQKLKKSKDAVITGDEFNYDADINKYKKNAESFAKGLRGSYTNTDTGRIINLSSGKQGGVKEVLRHDQGDIAHIQSVAAIPQIIENSVYITSAPNEDVSKNPNILYYEYYLCGLKINDADYVVKAVVGVDANGDKYYDHSLTEIEKGKLVDELAPIFNSTQSGLSSVSTQEEAGGAYPADREWESKDSPLSKVKDKRLVSILQNNSSKIVDENGEPRVVYHGTKHKFWAFDGGKSRGQFGDGLNYFALDREFSERWVRRDTDWQRDPEDNEKLDKAYEKSLEHKREMAKPLIDKYGKDYWNTDEFRELEKEFDQWERDNLDLDGMTIKEAIYDYNKRILPVFINARNPYNPSEQYDKGGKEMLQRLGVIGENPDPMTEMYARNGSYIYYERKDVVDELKKMGYDAIFLTENVSSDHSKNLRTLAVWDSNRIKLAEPTTYDDNGNEIPLDDRFTESNDIRYRLGDGFGASADASVIESAVNETADKLNTLVVIEHGTPAGVNKDALGWYNPNDGSVHVNVDAARNAADAIATVLHEAVGHHGLRKLLGDRFDKAMDTLRSMATKEIRDKIDAIAKEQGVDALTATEEYLAQLAEQGATNNEELSFWEKAKAFVRSLLRSIGINVGDITDADLNYLIWASKRNLEQNGGDLLRAADNAIIRSAMKKMAQGSHEVERETPETLYRSASTPEYAKAVVARQYEKRIAESRYQFREAMQDSMLSLRDFMLATLKEEGKDVKYIEDIAGFENAYLAENALSSKTKIEQDTFGKLLFDPLVKEISMLAKTADERQELTDYMMAKHGLERNEKFAQRDAIRFYKNIMDATVEAAKKDASLSDQARADAIDAAEQEFNAHKAEIEAGTDKKYKEFRKQDYSGLTALTEEDNVADAEAKAADMVRDYEFDHDTTDLWKLTKDVTSAIMSKMGEGGIVTRAGAKEISDMFEYYIPLRGFDETTSDEAYAYLDDSHGPLNTPILKAEGRESKADDPIATLANMADTAIMQANRNAMKQKFLNFVLNHPTDLVSVNDLWIRLNDITGEWEAVFPELDENDPPSVIDQKVEQFEEDMKNHSTQEPDKYKKAKDAKHIPYRVINGHLKEHQILIRRLGKTYVLTVNGNPRLAQALNGETNPDATQKGVLGAVGRLAKSSTTTLSQLYTTRNPEFIASNFMRDAIYANSMNWIKEGPKYAAAFHKNFGKLNPAKLVGLLRKFENDELDENNATEKAFKEFMMNGGETGYTNVKDIERQKKAIAKQIKKKQGRLPVGVAMDALGDTMDLLNRAVENCARFAAFVTSREQGRSLERSIYDAKEISVNFNKKGAGDRFYRAQGQTWWGNFGAFISGAGREFYAFWNAGLQGTTNFARAAKRHPVKFGFGAAAMFTVGALMPMMYEYLFGGDDDDENSYYNLPEYVRRSNICFKAGENWITIPLPIEMRALYGLGELASGQMMGRENYDEVELAYQIGSQVSQVFPLDMLEGGGGFHALIPTAAKPIAEAYMNRKWTGLPLYQKNSPWNEDMPEWTKAFKSTNTQLVNLTAALNGITADYGDKYEKGVVNLNPARIEYMLNGYLGGYATTAQTLVKMGEMAVGTRDFDWNNMLIARRFVKPGDETTEFRKLNNEYYKIRDEYEHVKKQVKRYEENEDEEKLRRLEASDEYKHYEIMGSPSSLDPDKSYYAKIDELNRASKNAEDEQEAEDIKKEMYEVIRDLMDEIRKAEEIDKSKD